MKTQRRVQRSSPPLQAPHATSARVNRWRSPRAGWLSLCLSPRMGERCHSPFTRAELAAVSPVPRSIGARCGSSSCAAGLSTPAAAALRFVVSRLGERGPRCRLGAACLVGDGRRLRFSPGPGESAFSSATGARLRVGLFAVRAWSRRGHAAHRQCFRRFFSEISEICFFSTYNCRY